MENILGAISIALSNGLIYRIRLERQPNVTAFAGIYTLPRQGLVPVDSLVIHRSRVREVADIRNIHYTDIRQYEAASSSRHPISPWLPHDPARRHHRP